MVTMVGEKMASRVAASLLRATGLDELVCTSYSGEHTTPFLCLSVVKLFFLQPRGTQPASWSI
jgi:hypothetical protein